MHRPPPLRGYPVDHGLRRAARARRRRTGIARRVAALLRPPPGVS